MNTKTIDHKAEDVVSIIMDLQSRCVLYEMIPKCSHMFYKFLVGNDPSLFNSIHALFDARVDPPLVVYHCSEVLSINDFLWDYFQWNAHEFRVW